MREAPSRWEMLKRPEVLSEVTRECETNHSSKPCTRLPLDNMTGGLHHTTDGSGKEKAARREVDDRNRIHGNQTTATQSTFRTLTANERKKGTVFAGRRRRMMYLSTD